MLARLRQWVRGILKGGLGPDSIAVTFGMLSAGYFVMPPRGRSVLPGWEPLVGVFFLLAVGLTMALLGRAMKQAQRRAEDTARALQEANEQLERRVRERTAELLAKNEALRAEEERCRLLIDGIKEHALFMLDTTGHIITWNPGAQRSKGYEAHEIIGSHFSRLYPEEDVASGKPDHALAQALRNGRFEDEGWRVRKDGTRFFGKVILTALRDARGQLRGFAKLTRDISMGQQAHEKFYQEAESAFNPMVIVDAQGRLTMVNTSAEKLFGYSRTELLGRHVEILLPSRLQGRHSELRTQFLAGPMVRAMGAEKELVAQRRDGSEFPVEIKLTPITTAAGIEVHCALLDLTGRRQAEAALRASEAQLRLFVEQAPVSIAMFDLQMVCSAASRRWHHDYGRGQENLVGVSHYDVHPHLPERWKEVHRRGLAGEVQQCEEDLWVHEDGSKNWLRWAVHPWRDASGQLGGIIVFAEDITARKRDAELLHKQQQQLALITRNMASPLALFDHERRCLFANAAYERWFSRSLAEIIGHTVDEITGPAATERARPYARRVLLGEQITYENYFTNASGQSNHGLITISPQCATDGQISTFVVTISDVTELKRAEHALREANEALERRVQDRTAALVAANKELEAFSYTVSHDLRAPLRAIDGFSRILLESYAAELPAEAQEYLRDVRANTQQMGRLVDDLLAFSRLGRLTMRMQSLVTADLVSSVVQSLQATHGRRVELRIGELPPCRADPGLLKQVWFNLLDNAMKYTGKRDPAIIEVGFVPDSNPLVYYVKDNGVGFDMRYSHKLFGVFQRLHRAEDYEGTGVGLAIVQRIVQRHGGRVWAEAEPDRGATFFFTLARAGEFLP